MVDANVAAGGDPNILAITPTGKALRASYTATGCGHRTATDTVTSTITLFESATRTRTPSLSRLTAASSTFTITRTTWSM